MKTASIIIGMITISVLLPTTGLATRATAACHPTALLTGYWPPTNEMLRAWAPGPSWQGENWHNLGYDVYAHFPEFPPDGDPSNNRIGDLGSVGTGELTVDYQQTSADFWRLISQYQPHVLITTSRGGDIDWELEALEGGHGPHIQPDPSRDWRSDGHGEAFYPEESSITRRSWQAINTFRAGIALSSQLPLERLKRELSTLNRLNVEIDRTGTSGNYLSGFIALHGLYYNRIEPNNLAAGHIHVGRKVPVIDATAMMHATLDIVLREHPAERACDRDTPAEHSGMREDQIDT